MALKTIADDSYLERLREYVAAAEAKDASLVRKGERFAQSLASRQRRNLDLIISNPRSRRYRDYIMPALAAQEGGE